METLWFCLVAVMIAVYVVLDGFDLGAGIVHLLVARTDAERRTVLRSIGPVWDGNEVWLLAGGGTLYFAFPRPLRLQLQRLLPAADDGAVAAHPARPSRSSSATTSTTPSGSRSGTWSSAAPAPCWPIFFGAALGNVVRGVPLDAAGRLLPAAVDRLPAGAEPGILDWYTVLVALAALATLTLHGALWVALKTEGAVSERARGVARRLWWGVLALTVLITLASFAIQPHFAQSFRRAPVGLRLPAAGADRTDRLCV